MNYRHAFHAGGFADVIKHIVLVRILTHLQDKPAAFRVIDSHAGAGRYDLAGEEARRAADRLAAYVADIAAQASVPAKCLRVEFSVAPQVAGGRLTSAGLLIVNPPWKLADELKAILPELEKPLGQGGAGRFRLEAPKS